MCLAGGLCGRLVEWEDGALLEAEAGEAAAGVVQEDGGQQWRRERLERGEGTADSGETEEDLRGVRIVKVKPVQGRHEVVLRSGCWAKGQDLGTLEVVW